MARSSTSPKRSDRETVVTLRLPRDLHDRLKAAASERGFAADIRQRLEASVAGTAPAAADPQTNELLLQIAELSKIVEKAYGNWHTDPGAFAVFQLAINKTLSGYQPTGKAEIQLKNDAPSALRGVTDIETAAVAASLAASSVIW
jgi:hypothetical protein